MLERAGDEHALVLGDERQAVRLGEVGVGFVDDQRAGQGGGEPSHRRPAAATVPDGLLGLARNASFSRSAGAVKSAPSDQSASKSTIVDRRALNRRERVVQDVARPREADEVARADERCG